MTVGRLTAGRPELEVLLGLPVGSLVMARGGELVLVAEEDGQVLWRAARRAGED